MESARAHIHYVDEVEDLTRHTTFQIKVLYRSKNHVYTLVLNPLESKRFAVVISQFKHLSYSNELPRKVVGVLGKVERCGVTATGRACVRARHILTETPRA